jgi:hypothetical protein
MNNYNHKLTFISSNNKSFDLYLNPTQYKTMSMFYTDKTKSNFPLFMLYSYFYFKATQTPSFKTLIHFTDSNNNIQLCIISTENPINQTLSQSPYKHQLLQYNDPPAKPKIPQSLQKKYNRKLMPCIINLPLSLWVLYNSNSL